MWRYRNLTVVPVRLVCRTHPTFHCFIGSREVIKKGFDTRLFNYKQNVLVYVDHQGHSTHSTDEELAVNYRLHCTNCSEQKHGMLTWDVECRDMTVMIG